MKAALALASLVSAASAGLVTIQNNCAFTVHWQNDTPTTCTGDNTLQVGANTSIWLRGLGHALKFSPTSDFVQPISFDYSCDHKVWYDISDEPGTPFALYAAPVLPTSRPVSCSAGPDSPCSQTVSTEVLDVSFNVTTCSKTPVSSQQRRMENSAKMGQRVI
jgi:hypothetical protein